MAIHFSILAWEILWTEEVECYSPLQRVCKGLHLQMLQGLQRVGHNGAINTCVCMFHLFIFRLCTIEANSIISA